MLSDYNCEIVIAYPFEVAWERFDDELFFQKMKIIVMKRDAEGIQIDD
jgi:hypothetical protein